MEDGASNQLLEDWSYKQNVDIVKDGYDLPVSDIEAKWEKH